MSPEEAASAAGLDLRHLAAVSTSLESKPATAAIEWAVDEFGDGLTLASSFQDCVLVDLAMQVDPNIEVVFLDTQYHFAETLWLNQIVGGFFRGQLVVAFIVGCMVSAGLFAIRLPLWLVVGMIAGLFNIIPLIGPYIGAIPGIIVALATKDVKAAIAVAIVMVVAQQIDNHFITPFVMKRAVHLHPAAVVLALLVFGTLGGFFGLLLAVPLTAAMKVLGGHLWRRYVMGVSVPGLDEPDLSGHDPPEEGVMLTS